MKGCPMSYCNRKAPFVKRREFLPGSGFLSRRDMTYVVESDVDIHSILHNI